MPFNTTLKEFYEHHTYSNTTVKWFTIDLSRFGIEVYLILWINIWATFHPIKQTCSFTIVYKMLNSNIVWLIIITMDTYIHTCIFLCNHNFERDRQVEILTNRKDWTTSARSSIHIINIIMIRTHNRFLP